MADQSESKVESATGKCLCGAVTFTAHDVDTHVHACHCSMCRKWGGGPNLSAEVGSVSFSGVEHIKRFNSSEWAERGFCTECGTNLFYHLKEPEKYIMCGGAFDDAEQFSLTGEIFIDEKPATYDFAGDHPRMTAAEFMASVGA